MDTARRGASRACEICGNPSAGRNYKVICCQSCRLFFVRSIKFKLRYECLTGRNTCSTFPRYNFCRACRLKICYEHDMDPNKVGKRVKKKLSVEEDDSSPKIDGSLGQKQFLTRENVTKKAGEILALEKYYMKMDTSLYSSLFSTYSNPNVTLEEMICQHGFCASKDTAAFICDRLPPYAEYSIVQSYCRVFQLFLDFLSLVPEVQQINSYDKMLLIQQGFVAYWLMTALQVGSIETQRQFLTEIDRSSLPHADKFYFFHIAGSLCPLIATVFRELNQLKLTEFELLYFKIIVIFSGQREIQKGKDWLDVGKPKSFSAKGANVIANAKRNYLVRLEKVMRSAYSTEILRKERFQRISDYTLQLIQEVSQSINDLLILMILSNIGGMMNNLAYDLHLR